MRRRSVWAFTIASRRLVLVKLNNSRDLSPVAPSPIKLILV